MIISASRRTDIPTYYSDWFFNCIKEGFVCVRNPMNAHQISKINLSTDVIDGIVFWTKNPLPMINRLDEIANYNYYFQFTLNAYGKDVEPNIPSKSDIIIPTFQKLAEKIGSNRVIWRYDPIFLTDEYSMEYHIKYFEKIARKLYGSTNKCIISFLDGYSNSKRNTKHLNISMLNSEQKTTILGEFSKIAKTYKLNLETCCEDVDLTGFDVSKAHCIDKNIFEEISGSKFDIEKDKTQRENCGCMASIDIGAYNTCKNGCYYCYANANNSLAETNFQKHSSNSPILLGEIESCDKISERKVVSCRMCQMNLFDLAN